MTSKLTLAITNIGDLLLNGCITQNEKGQPIENIDLAIPYYQRPYKWTAKNAIQLLDDIIHAKNENRETYRVGTLILHYDKEKDVHNIVDGQQRTITFALLLKAFQEESKVHQNGNPRSDGSDLQEKEIPFLDEKVTENPYNLHNIVNNYRSLRRRVRNLGEAREQNELVRFIRTQCELIVVITDDQSEAFQFFDSQNARGKKLYPHDLLKAYHLREMAEVDASKTEKIVRRWEDLDQKNLSSLFQEYLYRIKEWSNGDRAIELNENNIGKFKGISKKDIFPYAQFYKGGFLYADRFNNSGSDFVIGINRLKPFQINTPVVAGKPFFEYADHYFRILQDIQNNDKYEGYFINDNDIVKTLNLHYSRGVGNKITRLLFDTVILLYVDRFCPEIPSRQDLDLLDQFTVFAFVWAYSLRAQYINLGWPSAQNYIMGTSDRRNGFNLYRVIANSDSPVRLLSMLSDMIEPLSFKDVVANQRDRHLNKKNNENILTKDEETGIYKNYLSYFQKNDFLIITDGQL